MVDERAVGAKDARTRRVLLLDLKDDAEAIARYEACHRPGGVPLAVLASIRAAGIEAMTIHRAGNRLVMIVEASLGFDAEAKAAADAADPAVRAWEARMDELQQRLPFAAPGEKWVAATPIFDLAAQDEAAACA